MPTQCIHCLFSFIWFTHFVSVSFWFVNCVWSLESKLLIFIRVSKDLFNAIFALISLNDIASFFVFFVLLWVFSASAKLVIISSNALLNKQFAISAFLNCVKYLSNHLLSICRTFDGENQEGRPTHPVIVETKSYRSVSKARWNRLCFRYFNSVDDNRWHSCHKRFYLVDHLALQEEEVNILKQNLLIRFYG